MKIKLIAVGKTVQKYLSEGENEYLSRLKHYCTLEYVVIPELKNAKNMSTAEIQQKEGELILKQCTGSDSVILLDVGGAMHSSESFAQLVENLGLRGTREVSFVVGGAYGFSAAVYARCNEKISLSKMTFSHQMVRLIFLEQLYRAHTILRGQPYHH